MNMIFVSGFKWLFIFILFNQENLIENQNNLK